MVVLSDYVDDKKKVFCYKMFLDSLSWSYFNLSNIILGDITHSKIHSTQLSYFHMISHVYFSDFS